MLAVLAGIQYTPAGCEGDVRALDDFILLAVRLDMYLIDLCNSIHAFVGRAQPTTRGGERELAEMKFDSERRVRKCLRLVACVFRSSQSFSPRRLFLFLLLPGFTPRYFLRTVH